MQVKHLLIGGMVALAACGGDSTSPGTIGESGSLSFSFTGAGGGTYSASGAVSSNATTPFGTTPWAAAATGTQGTDIVAVVPKSGTSWDLATLFVARATTGTSTIDPNCSAVVCTRVAILFGSNTLETSYTYLCTLTSGSVTLSTISTTHISGSFSGSGTCTTPGGVVSLFALTNGNFDVGILPAVPD